MRWVFNKYNLSGIFYGLILLLGYACSRNGEDSVLSVVSGDQNAVRISVRVSGDATVAESAVRTLRLFIFSVDDGSMLLNKYYLTSEAKTEIPSDSYTYFANVAGEYKISEMLSKGSIRIVLVANEPMTLGGNYTLEKLKGMIVNYYDLYNNSGTLNIVIDATSQSSNKGYIPMVAESDALTRHEWDASAGKVVTMQLVRTLAKATLQISYNKNSGVFEHPDDKVTITGATVKFVPIYGYLGFPTKPYEAEQVNISGKVFDMPLVITPTTDKLVSNTLSFYLPEHTLSDVTYNNKKYTYLQINATYYSGDIKKDYNSTYKIALGDGVGGLASLSDVNTLSKEGLAVSRNTIYEVKAQVTTHGKLDIFQVEVGVVPWQKAEDVGGDIEAPVLNITGTEVRMSQKTVRVHFWSNQSSLFIGERGEQDGGIDFGVNDIFQDLTSTDNSGNFHLYAESDKEYEAYNGYLDIEFKDPAAYTQEHTYTLTLNAGGLKRAITVISNPRVGEIVFDANGGSGSYTYDIKYVELTGNPLYNAEITLTDPKARFTPPAGKEFLMWVYSNGESEVKSENGNCIVTLAGYTTKVKALWKNK